MAKSREDSISFAVRFAEMKLGSFQDADWRKLPTGFERFFDARGRGFENRQGETVGRTIDPSHTGGIVAIPGEGKRGRSPQQMMNVDFENLQRRLRSVLRQVAWTREGQRDPHGCMEARARRARPQPTFHTRDVEVKFSGTVELIATGDGKTAILLSGPPEETFLTTVLFVLSRAKRLPIGTCLECHRLFHR